MKIGPAPLRLTSNYRTRLLAAIEAQEPHYDDTAGMIRHRLGSAYDYNTYLRDCDAHATRKSLWYANQLLNAGEEAYRLRAERVIAAVLDCQVTDRESQHLGVWPHFAEEPIPTGPYVDLNWADFCGVALIQAWLYHRHRIMPPIVCRIEKAIRLAAAAIQRRNVGPDYTNIAIMGTYVTLVGGERLGDKGLVAYGAERLQRFADFTDRCGGFQEFNSPTYTLVALKELSRLRLHVLGHTSRQIADRLHVIAWQEIADHFHAPSQQWGGPHSRTYFDLMTHTDRDFFARWTGVNLYGAEDAGRGCPEEDAIDAACPPELRGNFQRLDAPRLHQRTLHATEQTFRTTCFQHPAFSLGTTERSMMWNQCRPLLAYLGPKHDPTAFRVRVLLNGYDFTAATLFSQQDEGRVLAGVSFDPSAGVKHPVFDRMTEGHVRVNDLCVRFAFSGCAPVEIEEPRDPRDPCRWYVSGVSIHAAILGAAFETPGAYPTWRQAGKRDSTASEADWDFVLLERDDTKVRLGSFPAWLIFGLQLNDDAGATKDFRTAVVRDDIKMPNITAEWEGLRLEIPRVPADVPQCNT